MTYLTPKMMAEAEKGCGVPLDILMNRAGEALARRALALCREKMRRRVLLLCGNGNNGGDGFVAAEQLLSGGADATVLLCCGQPKTDLAVNAFREYAEMFGARITEASQADVTQLADESDIIIDCIFGTGFRGGMPGAIAEIIDAVNCSQAYRLACDVPSGVNSLTGEVSNAFLADETVVMHSIKLGQALSPAVDYCGRITVADIGITSEKGGVELFDLQDAKESLPRRISYGHKGTFGKLVCVTGSERYTGAAAMSALAALRSGVGIVCVATGERVVDRLAASISEATYLPLPSNGEGFTSCLGAEALLKECETADAVLFGCGMGRTNDTAVLLESLIRSCACPVIIDADGINCLSANIDILKSKRGDIILTPHPMELARLCGCETPPADRYGAATRLSKEFGVTVMAKGPQTFVAGKDGELLCRRGNTALSKGGSGDMLAGLTAGFAAQGASADKACALASVVLGLAAEELSVSRSQRGIIASDILAHLPETLFNLEKLGEI